MSVLGFAGPKGAPGVTTLVLALAHAWARSGRSVLLVEADPDGGSIATGVLQGRAPGELGLVQLAAYRGADPATAIRAQCVQLDDEPLVLLGPNSPHQGIGAVGAWPVLAAGLRAMRTEADLDVLIDLGRARPDAPTTVLIPTLDRLVWVTKSNLAGILAMRAAVTATSGRGYDVAVVLVGPDRPYRAAEIAEAVGAPVLGQVPYDERAVAHLTGGNPWGASRFSAWHRAISALSTTLQQPTAAAPSLAEPKTGAVRHG